MTPSPPDDNSISIPRRRTASRVAHAAGELIPLSRSMRRDLKRERLRTGVSPRGLIAGMESPPEGLRARYVNGWLTGRIREGNWRHFAIVIETYQALPDAKDMGPEQRRQHGVGSNSIAARTGYIPLTTEMSQVLISECERTGLRGKPLLRALSQKAPRVTAALLRAWRLGSVNSVDPTLWAATLAVFDGLPAQVRSRGRPTTARNARPISSEDHARIEAERTRTGVHPCALVRGSCDRPAIISENMVAGWVSRRTKTADPESIAWLLEQYAQLPDLTAGSRARRKSLPRELRMAGYRAVTELERHELRTERRRTGVPAITLVNSSADAPKLLTGYTVNGWISGATAYADPVCIAWVLERYRALPDREGRGG